jgi:GMP synthase (glutamine-hydrolysing)
MPNIHADRILILDFGSQYTQLIARRMREAGVYCEMHPGTWRGRRDPRLRTEGVILSGGPQSVHADETPRADPPASSSSACRCSASATACRPWPRSSAAGRPRRRARVRLRAGPRPRWFAAAARHRGPHQPRRLRPARRLDEPRRPVEALPRASVHRRDRQCAARRDRRRERGSTASSSTRRSRTRPRAGASSSASAMRSAAAADCGRRRVHHRRRDRPVRQTGGDDEVLLGLSGGVDSSVVAALLHRAIGDRSPASSSTTACCAMGEGDQVMATFARHMGVRVLRVDAEALPRTTRRRRDPEAEAQDHRQHLHRGLRGRGSALPRGASNGWPRARSIRTSSSRPAPRPARPR